MMLILPIVSVLIASFVLARIYLPRMSMERRGWVLYVARLAVASGCAFIGFRGHPGAIALAILFAIFAWGSRPVKSPIAG